MEQYVVLLVSERHRAKIGKQLGDKVLVVMEERSG